MRTGLKWVVAIAVIALCFYVYSYITGYSRDEFESYLDAMGFNPLRPPRDGFRLGSLYDIDADGNLGIVCAATEQDVEGLIVSGVGANEVLQQAKTGVFSISGDVEKQIKSSASSGYDKKISMKFSNVHIFEIPSDEDGNIQSLLMKKPPCKKTVDDYVRLGRYICQAQSVFSADAEYDVEQAEHTGASADHDSRPPNTPQNNIAEVVAEAVQAQTTVKVTVSGNKITIGKALVFGAKLDPVCITPRNALFVRTWPHNALARAWNYVKYQIIEPVFAKDTRNTSQTQMTLN